MLDYLLDQVVAMLMHSSHVEEVYAEDVVLRRRMAPHLQEAHGRSTPSSTPRCARSIKHVKEGTSQWDIEYARVLETVKRRRGLG